MTENPVPVSLGSSDFGTWRARSALVTRVSLPAWTLLPTHMHEHPTFAVILSGGFDLEFTRSGTRERRIACGVGTIVTQPAGERHINHVGADGASGIVLQPYIAGDGLPPRCARILDDILHFHNPVIAHAARRLAREVTYPDDLTAMAVDSLVLEMLVHAARLESGTGPWRFGVPAWLKTATQYLHDHFLDAIRIETIAALAGVSSAHLCHVFRRHYGLTLHDYLRRLRIDWAAEQLLATHDPVAEIAVTAGFADQAHFTRWFRRATGWTPAAYRRIQRKARSV